LGAENDQDNRVVILVKVQTATRESTIGIRVDAVSDVYAISADQISAAPELAENSVKNFVTGLATVEDKMIIMLDIDALISIGILEADMHQGRAEGAPTRSPENA
jgi:purine-binding chemotaxis protein CheW